GVEEMSGWVREILPLLEGSAGQARRRIETHKN
ncbi:unnamed protein product, partial [marine sediment metagenome]